ncbi:hypothetical protein DRW03_14895 [Corallococcus sp. H22C18031201]|nr:hypothetical protein DRW03_14895 [Corallococcus sp. H22C18031201]
MRLEYATRASLQARINSCFMRSENGKALCVPEGDGGVGTCDANADMEASLTDMTWLDAQ